MKILDCTLRDGGYYTNWDFSPQIVKSYIEAINSLPVDYLEIGYRNNSSKEYLGKFGYSPISVLSKIRMLSTKKLVIMLNEKSTCSQDLIHLLKPIQGIVDMVRIAVDPQNFTRAIKLAEAIKKHNIEVGFNTMYMSKWYDYQGFIQQLSHINGIVDLFCMVDSFGGVTPDEVKRTYNLIRDNTTCPIGFHGHNNLQLGLINTLTAIECGAEVVDATVLGMGRGAGNLNLELLLTYLNKQGIEIDFNILSDLIMLFQPLYEKYKWGTNLPYMLSGANSISQKEVMDWVSNRTYSFNSIIRALNNKRINVIDNARYPLFGGHNAEKILLIGGGNSTIDHKNAIIEYIANNPKMALIFATARHAIHYNDLPNKKYYCLVGNEAKRMTANITKKEFNGTCILPPYPRKMGTEVPIYAEQNTYELREITFTQQFGDSCSTVALQTALFLGAKEINITGYDGYRGGILSEKEADLSNENRAIFGDFFKSQQCKLKSLTPTLYKEIEVVSIYQLLRHG